MSAATVRAAITDWFQPPAVLGLNEVFPAAPWFADGGEWSLASDLGYGALGFVHLERSRERRIAMPATAVGRLGAGKWVQYDVGLVVLYQYLIPQSEDVTLAPSGYAGPLDGILDGIKDRIRSSPTLGTTPGPNGEAPTIFQAGQGDGTENSDDITVEQDLPRRDIRRIWSWNVVQFTAVEIVAA